MLVLSSELVEKESIQYIYIGHVRIESIIMYNDMVLIGNV